VCLRVRDTGIGIAPEVLPRVFDLFAQGDAGGGRAEGGLGLGLALVKSLVELHGGAVQAHSPGRGRGSEFVVRLPLLAEAPAPAGGTDPTRPRAGCNPCRVLVVDDSRDAADSLALLLRVSGHETRTAYDGPSALREAGAFRPDVVLCDIGLPGMNGLDLARRLRALPGLAGARLAALTGFGTEEDRRQSQAASFDYHLVKPVELDALRELLEGPGPGAERNRGSIQ
jgi:CheY-like chemotaxis protein